jgi:hypothetical protein
MGLSVFWKWAIFCSPKLREFGGRIEKKLNNNFIISTQLPSIFGVVCCC